MEVVLSVLVMCNGCANWSICVCPVVVVVVVIVVSKSFRGVFKKFPKFLNRDRFFFIGVGPVGAGPGFVFCRFRLPAETAKNKTNILIAHQ